MNNAKTTSIKALSWQDCIPLRHSVLWPDKPPAFCEVEGDCTATHFGAFEDDKLVSVLSLFQHGDAIRLRKFATAEDYQGQGIGSALLNHALAYSRNMGASRFWCDAREASLGFYQRFGLEAEGERFYKGDIPYLRMSVEWRELA